MEKRKLTVCFADITNFNRVMQNFEVEQVVALLQQFFTEIGDVITKNNGEIRKYIGDALLFTFADPTDAVLAVKEIANINKTMGDHKLETHVSAATGEVLQTEIGHHSHKVMDIFGKTVNQAAILLSEASQSINNYALCPETIKYL